MSDKWESSAVREGLLTDEGKKVWNAASLFNTPLFSCLVLHLFSRREVSVCERSN